MHWLDPDYLPEISGTFERFLLNLHGDADGMILADGTEVHFPPHMSAELCAAIRPGRNPRSDLRRAAAQQFFDRGDCDRNYRWQTHRR